MASGSEKGGLNADFMVPIPVVNVLGSEVMPLRSHGTSLTRTYQQLNAPALNDE